MLRSRLSAFRRAAALVAVALAAVACDRPTRPDARARSAELRLFAVVPSAATSRLAVEVTGADIPSPLLFDLPVADGVASGSLSLPAGTDRVVTVRAYSGSVETHRGSVTVTVRERGNAPVSVRLEPLAGDVPITASIGGVRVEVAPTETRAAVGFTVQLVARVFDELGNEVNAPVTWASLNTGRAEVSATGVVTAKDSGAVNVVASARGFGGAALVRVIPRTTFASVLVQRADTGFFPSWVRTAWGSGPNTVFVGGERGLARFDGTAWRRIAFAPAGFGAVRAMWGLSENEIYAVGFESLRAARWNGAAWSFLPDFPARAGASVRTVTDIWASATADVWVSANDGEILRYDGAAWSATQVAPPGTWLHSVWGTSATDVWAAGDVSCATAIGCASVYHFDGASWTPVRTPVATSIHSIHGRSSTDVWVAGGEVMRFDGTAWTRLPSRDGRPFLNAVWVTGPGEAYAGNHQGEIYRFADGLGVREARVLGEHVAALYGSGAGDVVAVGWPGAVYRRGGAGTWGTEATSGGMMGGLWGFSATDVWAVETHDAVLRYDGSTWTREVVGTRAPLHDIWGWDAANLIVVGSSGTIARRVGGAWAPMTSGTQARLNGVHGTSPTSAWAVGDQGTILRFDGSAWVPVPSGTTAHLRDVWSVSDSEAWAVGDFGAMLRWDGRVWRRAAPDGGHPSFHDAPQLAAVWAMPGVVVAVSTAGFAIRYTSDGRWVKETLPSSPPVRAVFGFSPNDIVALAWTGAHYRFDGTTWQSMPISIAAGSIFTSRIYSSLWGASPGTIFLGAEFGVLARMTR